MKHPHLLVQRTFPCPALVLVGPDAVQEARTIVEATAVRYAWAPRSTRFAYQVGHDLYVSSTEGPPERLLGELPISAKRTFAFHPRAGIVAVLAADAIFVLPIRTGSGGGQRIPLPPTFQAFDVAWFRGGDGIVVAGADAKEQGLVLVDLWMRDARFVASDSELLCAGGADGPVTVRRAHHDTGESEAGVLSDDGAFVPLFRVPEGFFVADYLPSPNLFLVAESAEHGTDPTRFILVSQAGLPGAPWLDALPQLADWTFSPDGSLMAAVDGASDAMIVAAVGDDAVLQAQLLSDVGDDADPAEYVHAAPSDTRPKDGESP